MIAYQRKLVSDLTDQELATWATIQEETPFLDSPFFRPEFTQAVAAVRDDVEVIVCLDQAEPVGFLPYQRGKLGVGRPVGGPLSGCQAVIARPETDFNPLEILQASGLSSWKFDHLLGQQPQLARFHHHFEPAPFIDLSQGFEAYRAARRKAGSQRISKIKSRARKLEREHGTLELQTHVGEPEVLETLVRWKRQQYRRTKLADVFAYDWTTALLEYLLQHPTDGLSPMLTLLCADDVPVAISYGLRSHGVLYGWFTAFDRSFSRYGPGLMLIVMMAEAVVPLGVRRIDMGKSDDDFKTRLMSDSTTLASGFLAQPSVANSLRAGLRQTVRWVRKSPLGAPVEVPIRLTQGLRDWIALQ